MKRVRRALNPVFKNKGNSKKPKNIHLRSTQKLPKRRGTPHRSNMNESRPNNHQATHAIEACHTCS